MDILMTLSDICVSSAHTHVLRFQAALSSVQSDVCDLESTASHTRISS